MPERTVMIVMGTRPEAIKLAPIIQVLRANALGLRPIVCVTGQHREMLDQVLDWFAISADMDLDLMQTNQELSGFASRALLSLGSAIRNIGPKAVLVQGDTTTAAMGALAAFYQRIPVAHVEAGLRTYRLYDPFPEEVNRRIVSAVSSFHFAPTARARAALLSEGFAASTVFEVGNTVVDALKWTIKQKERVVRPIELKGQRSILVTAHRRESFGLPFESMCKAMRDLVERNDDVEIIFPVHMNPIVRSTVTRLLQDSDRIRLIEPLRYEQFIDLMSRVDLILTDSGGIQEEASVLGIPTLVMRNTTERHEAVECGAVKLVGTDQEAIVSNTERLLRDRDSYTAISNARSPFGDGSSAEKVVGILANILVFDRGEKPTVSGV